MHECFFLHTVEITLITVFFKVIYFYFMCIGVLHSCLCGWVLEAPELELQTVASCRVCWELNLGPLEDQSGLTTAEPALQPPEFF